MTEQIDWSKFKDFSEHTCECRCGVVYRSHAKGTVEDGWKMTTQKPCPGCGETVNNCRKYECDTEIVTIGGKP